MGQVRLSIPPGPAKVNRHRSRVIINSELPYFGANTYDDGIDEFTHEGAMIFRARLNINLRQENSSLLGGVGQIPLTLNLIGRNPCRYCYKRHALHPEQDITGVLSPEALQGCQQPFSGHGEIDGNVQYPNSIGHIKSIKFI